MDGLETQPLGSQGPPGLARQRLYPGTLYRHSGGAQRQSDSALSGHHAGSGGGANPGTVRFSLGDRTGPALAETDRAFAFATIQNARHGGKGVDLRGDGLQLRAGGDFAVSYTHLTLPTIYSV